MRAVTAARVRGCLLVAAALSLASCSSATGPRSAEVNVRRTTWSAHDLTSYTYDYQLRGFFIAFAGRWIHVVVNRNAVLSATDVATGQPMPEPLSTWPTIDQLFDQAEQAAAAGALTGIRYDPDLGYPTEIDIAGPPDASGSILAENLTVTP